MIKAIIFDMDGLLIDSEPLWHEAEIEIFREVDIHLIQPDCLKTTGLRVDEVVDYWYRRLPWQSPSKQVIAAKILNKVCELIKLKAVAKEGVAEIMQFVKTLDVKVALASSSAYVLIHAAVTKFGWQDYFELIYSAQEEEFGKPHPGVYISTAKKLNVAPTECLAIEDSLNGVIAAKAARMKCIAVPEEVAREEQRFIIADIATDSLLHIDEKIWLQLNQ